MRVVAGSGGESMRAAAGAGARRRGSAAGSTANKDFETENNNFPLLILILKKKNDLH
jgi:hypothetical protein